MFNYRKLDKIDDEELFSKLFSEYIKSLTGVYDNYLVGHILDSEFYVMNYNKVDIGYFSIYKNKLLTQFFLNTDYIYIGQSCFKTIHNIFDFDFAYVPTCDELFLSLSLDFKKSITMQAYFFEDSNRTVEKASLSKGLLRLALLSDEDRIEELSEGFFENLRDDINDRKVYILGNNEEIYGFGIMEKNKLYPEHRGIGMYTVIKHRKKGVGRSIILHLKDLCDTLGYKPMAGCWYFNNNAKRTFESCGLISKTRLLKIEI